MLRIDLGNVVSSMAAKAPAPGVTREGPLIVTGGPCGPVVRLADRDVARLVSCYDAI